MQTYSVNNLPTDLIIGRQTETGVMDIRIDCAPWLAIWPELTLSIWVTPPGGAAAYPAVTHLEGDILVWDVNSGDTAVEGKGTMEVMGLAEDLKKLSSITTTQVLRTTTGATGEPPEPAQAWVDQVIHAAQTAATEAAEIAATEAAEQAAQKVLESIPDDYEALSEAVSEKAPAIYEDASGAMLQLTDGAEMPVQRLACVMQPVQAGSGDAALDNVRPITGWGSVAAAVTGQNLFDGGDISCTTNKRHSFSVPLPAGTYTISAIPTFSSDTSKKTCGMTLFDTNGSSIQSCYFYKDINDGPQMHTVTVVVPIGSIRFQASDTNTNSQGHTATWSNIQIVPGDRERIFTPYSGEILTAQLPETVYGGYADIVNGTGEKTMGFAELTGGENISLNSSETQGAGITIKGILPAIGNVDGICSHAITSPYLNTKNAMTLGRSNASWIYWTGILDTLGLSTVEEFKAWLIAQKEAGTPVQIAFQIAQPVPFQMEAQPISTQKGVNNIWSSTGEADVTYAADTKLYIDRKLAQLAAAQLNA